MLSGLGGPPLPEPPGLASSVLVRRPRCLPGNGGARPESRRLLEFPACPGPPSRSQRSRQSRPRARVPGPPPDHSALPRAPPPPPRPAHSSSSPSVLPAPDRDSGRDPSGRAGSQGHWSESCRVNSRSHTPSPPRPSALVRRGPRPCRLCPGGALRAPSPHRVSPGGSGNHRNSVGSVAPGRAGQSARWAPRPAARVQLRRGPRLEVGAAGPGSPRRGLRGTWAPWPRQGATQPTALRGARRLPVLSLRWQASSLAVQIYLF